MIESLLSADTQQSTAQAQAQAESSADDAPSIDELDQLLAEEIDGDEELAGDYQSVEAITAGIDTGSAEHPEDEHAASAHDVAAELDDQPEDLAMAGKPDDAGDLDVDLDAVAASKPAMAVVKEQPGEEADGPRRRGLDLSAMRDRLLRVCYTLNWPARRFLSPENRANLGYIALLNLFGAVAIWLYLILF